MLILAASAMAADWPNYRGPQLNGASQETDWSSDWPESGPKVLWTGQVGIGFSTMTVADGYVYTMGNKKIDDKEHDVVWCLNAETGEKKWDFSYEEPLTPNLYEGGPSATPTVHQGKVYTLSKSGKLYCLDAKTGDGKWQEDIAKTYGLKPAGWGYASSPLIMDGVIYLNAGTHGLALKASDKSLVWINETAENGYASVVPTTVDNKPFLLIFGSSDLAWVELKTGKVAHTFPFKNQYGINSADPIPVAENQVFISSGYGLGCALLEIKDKTVHTVYQNKRMKNQCYGSALYHGHVYGFDGQVNGSGQLACMDVVTGDIKWTQKNKDLGTGTVLIAGDRLIALGEKGKLFVLKAAPEGYEELASAQILTEKCWTMPVLANGLLYARDAFGKLVCLDLRQ